MQPTQTFDLNELLKDGSHIAIKEHNYTKIVEVSTNKTIAVFGNNMQRDVPSVYTQRTLQSGVTIWSDETTNLSGYTQRDTTFSPLLLDLICQQIAEGASLTRICKNPNMPSYAVLCAWKRKYPEIEARIEDARRDRAEFLRDEALEKADEATDKNDTPAATLKFEARKWAAGVDNAKYSPKSKVEATLNAPTQIIVHTGIVRKPLEENND